jgi:hypothetical protein
MKKITPINLLPIGTLVAVMVAGCSSSKQYPIGAYNDAPCHIVIERYIYSTRFVNGLARLTYEDLISGKDKNLFKEYLSMRRAAGSQSERCNILEEKLTEAAQQIVNKFSY